MLYFTSDERKKKYLQGLLVSVKTLILLSENITVVCPVTHTETLKDATPQNFERTGTTPTVMYSLCSHFWIVTQPSEVLTSYEVLTCIFAMI